MLRLVLTGFFAAVAVLLLKALLKWKAPTVEWAVEPVGPLTEPEQVFYWRLREACPEHLVLAQVALSQLLRAKRGANRQATFNRFSRLVADFVMCTKAFEVVAVCELDDRSHDGADRAAADARKSAALTAAGYRLIRVRVSKMPSVPELRALIAPTEAIVAAPADAPTRWKSA
jgi:very-short-patch-repair endonuclease